MDLHGEANNQITGASLDAPADCTIACAEGHITAHKLILCEHSKYLKDILSKYPNAEHPIIILTELNIIDIKILVNYMYTGNLVLTGDSSPTSLLRAAEILKIDSDSDEQIQTNHHHNHSIHHHHNHHQDHEDRMMNVDDEDEHEEDEDQDEDEDDSNNNSIEDDEDDDYIFNVEPDAIGAIGQSLAVQDKMLDNKNNKIRCHLCNIGLSDVKCLYRHVLTRHLPEKWGYKCEFCDREFSRDDHLMRHYTTKHKNMEFNREKIRETRRLNREMAKNFHDQISTS